MAEREQGAEVKRHGVKPELKAQVWTVFGRACWLRMPGCTGWADTVDHVIPVNIGGRNTLANLRPACGSCNRKRWDRVISGYGAVVRMVIGPPAGGKTTYVVEHRMPGDVVVDFDQLARCLCPGVESSHDFDRYVNMVARGAWQGAYRAAARLGDPVGVWCVKTDWLNHRGVDILDEWLALNYEVVVCDPGLEVCMYRLEAQHRSEAARQKAREWYRFGFSAAKVEARREARRNGRPAVVEGTDVGRVRF